MLLPFGRMFSGCRKSIKFLPRQRRKQKPISTGTASGEISAPTNGATQYNCEGVTQRESNKRGEN